MNSNICRDQITIILEKIVELQRRAVKEELQEKFCDHNFLGEENRQTEFNTRPIQIFTDDDVAWHCPIEKEEDGCNEHQHERTCVFRVEKVENDAVTLRALKEKKHSEEMRQNDDCFNKRFKSTNSFITIRITSISAIRCLRDTFVDLCIR